MLLKWTKDKIIITTVVRIPMTVDSPMIALLAVSADWLNISHLLQLGLQRPPSSGSKKKFSWQIKLEVVLSVVFNNMTFS